jgi:hypothetical protein
MNLTSSMATIRNVYNILAYFTYLTSKLGICVTVFLGLTLHDARVNDMLLEAIPH